MQRPAASRNISFMAAALFAVAFAALVTGVLFPVFPRQLDIRVNDLAARTIRAPRDAQFESQFLTTQARDEAAAAVPPTLIFDQQVRSRQLDAYDAFVGQINEARDQIDAERQQTQIAELGLSTRSATTAVTLPEDRWIAVALEGRALLDAELGVSLDETAVAEARDSLDAKISAAFTADEAILSAEIIRPLIVSTLAVDAARSEEAREAARASVPPQFVEVQKNDAILAAGSRVDEVAIEKLRETGLLTSTLEWENVAAVAIIAVVAALALSGYLYALQPRGVTSERHLIALAVIAVLPLVVARFFLPVVLPDEERQFLAYALPVAAAPLLIAALLSSEVAVAVSAIVGVLIAFIAALLPDVSLVTSVTALDVFRLALVYAVAPFIGIYFVHGADRLGRYFTAGLAVALVTWALLGATWFIDPDRVNADFGWMLLASSTNGITSGLLAAGAFVTMGVLFGVTTRVQLMELAQLNSPLLRRLQDEAPGTFHHSIIVGNLAERAADMIGADALLTRVGCYYHDIGKSLQPGMYVENQMAGDNPHETMAPADSAEVIQQHVIGGIDLARRNRLPPRVEAFIPEHHGTRLVAYFYRRAAERDPDVDLEAFRYPGPRPQSRETAIAMLADSTEAVVRASDDRSPERIDAIIEEVIAERLAEGQLDECDLTLRDLRTIAQSFKASMRAVYHPRVAYPQPAPAELRRGEFRRGILRLPTRRVTNGDAAPPTTDPVRGRSDR